MLPFAPLLHPRWSVLPLPVHSPRPIVLPRPDGSEIEPHPDIAAFHLPLPALPSPRLHCEEDCTHAASQGGIEKMLPSGRRRNPMDWTPSVTLAARPQTHALRRLPLSPAPAPPEPQAKLVEGACPSTEGRAGQPRLASYRCGESREAMPLWWGYKGVPPLLENISRVGGWDDNICYRRNPPFISRSRPTAFVPNHAPRIPASIVVIPAPNTLTPRPNVVISDHTAPIYHDNICPLPDTASSKHPQMSSFFLAAVAATRRGAGQLYSS